MPPKTVNHPRAQGKRPFSPPGGRDGKQKQHRTEKQHASTAATGTVSKRPIDKQEQREDKRRKYKEQVQQKEIDRGQGLFTPLLAAVSTHAPMPTVL